MSSTQPDRPLFAIVLAAGEGSRMKSDRPKPIHRLCGKPMLTYVLDSLRDCKVDHAAIVVGHQADRVVNTMLDQPLDVKISFVEQAEQRGTGDAAIVGLDGLPDDLEEADVLVMPGDTPLLKTETMAELVRTHRDSDAAATVLTAVLDDATGYGRLVRNGAGGVERIVEHRDATAEQRQISEINTSIYCFKRSLLSPALRRLNPDNSQGEYYLTDVLEVLAEAGHPVTSVVAPTAAEASGVNDRLQLSDAEAELRSRINRGLQAAGITMLDPASTYVDATVTLGRDVTIFPGAILSGNTSVGEGTEIGPATRLVDTIVGAGCTIESTFAKDAVIGTGCTVGPFAVLSEQADVPDGTVTGPFYTSVAR